MTHPPCRSCNGRGWEICSQYGSTVECLSCFGTGHDDIDPFARCYKCYGPAGMYPPYECEKKCEGSKNERLESR